MGHIVNIKARYTTNSGILSEILIQEICESFKRSEVHLDLESIKVDPIVQQKQKVQNIIQTTIPE